MSSVLKTVKWFLWKNAHAKTESKLKREGEYIENDKSRLNRCIVGLEWKGLRCHKRASPLTVKHIKIENTEKYKEKSKQHHENNKNKIQEKKTKHYKNKEKYCEKNSKYREENK